MISDIVTYKWALSEDEVEWVHENISGQSVLTHMAVEGKELYIGENNE